MVEDHLRSILGIICGTVQLSITVAVMDYSVYTGDSACVQPKPFILHSCTLPVFLYFATSRTGRGCIAIN